MTEATSKGPNQKWDFQSRNNSSNNAQFISVIVFPFFSKPSEGLVDYAKAFDCVDHNKLWNIIKEMGIPYHFICLLRNLYAGQEATVRTGHGTIDWFQVGKGVHQGCILSPCLFNLYAEYIEMLGLMNHKLESRLPGEISTPQICRSESEEELKSLLMKVKDDSEKAGLKLDIQKTNTMASSPITSL